MSVRHLKIREKTTLITMSNFILQNEYRFFLAGGSIRPIEIANPAPEWITARIWSEILTLESLEPFKGIAQNFHTYLENYKKIFDSSEPEK